MKPIRLNLEIEDETGDIRMFYSTDKGVLIGDVMYVEYSDRDKLEDYLRSMRLDEEIELKKMMGDLFHEV
jgi:hypothetical protein|tara:strand:+ start:1775 stop:1984 length:210 start_codon:yes stop_codon:yes gene_type:complete